MIKKATSWTVLVYGVTLIALGVVGFLQGSLISLIASSGFGLLLLICSRFMFLGNRYGLYAATFCTALLTATFSVRYTIGHKHPMAILAVLSGGMLLFLLAQLTKWKKA